MDVTCGLVNTWHRRLQQNNRLFAHIFPAVFSFLLFLFPASPAFCAPSAKSTLERIPELAITYEKFELSNGLTVIVHEDHRSPLVAVRMIYKAGYANETKPEQYGASHILLKLMEKGSENFQDNITRALEHAGAVQINNYATPDITVFSSTVPVVALERALWFESDRMGHMLRAITDARFEEEQQITDRLIEQRLFNADDAIYDRIADQSFHAGHPYARPFTGMQDHESGLRLRPVKQWFRSYFTPNNAVLILSGDIDNRTARKYAVRYFGDIAPGPPLKKLTRISQTQTGSKRDSMDGQLTHPILVKVWDVPAFGDPELIQLRLAFDILANGTKSRLHQRMVIKDRWAKNISFQLVERALSSQLILMIDLKDNIEIHAAEEVIQEEITLLMVKGATSAEIEQAKLNSVVELLKTADRAGGKADILARGEVYQDNPSFYRWYERGIRRTNSNSIKNVLTSILRDSVYVLHVNEKIARTIAPAAVKRNQPNNIHGKVTFEFPQVENFKLNNGLQVRLLNRSEAPLLELSLIFDAGLASHEGKPGLPVLAFNHLLGSNTKTKETLQEVIKKTAGKTRITFNPDSSALHITLLKAYLSETLQTLTDIFNNPQLRQNVFDQEKKAAVIKLKRERNDPRQYAAHVLPKLLYNEGHPYTVSWTGSVTPNSLLQIKPETVPEYWKNWLRPDNATMTVAGDISAQELKTILDGTIASWNHATTDVHKKILTTSKAEHAGRIFIAGFPQMRESIIMAAQLTLPASDNRTIALSLVNDILGGRRSSRLRGVFEEEKGWGNHVYSEIRQLKGEQPYIVSATVPMEYTVEAVRIIFNMHRDLMHKEPLTSKELLWARGSRIREMPGSFETNRSLLDKLNSIVAQGLPVNLLGEYPALISQVSDEAVFRVAGKVLSPENLIWLVIGDHKFIAGGIRSLNFRDVVILDRTAELPAIEREPAAEKTPEPVQPDKKTDSSVSVKTEQTPAETESEKAHVSEASKQETTNDEPAKQETAEQNSKNIPAGKTDDSNENLTPSPTGKQGEPANPEKEQQKNPQNITSGPEQMIYPGSASVLFPVRSDSDITAFLPISER